MIHVAFELVKVKSKYNKSHYDRIGDGRFFSKTSRKLFPRLSEAASKTKLISEIGRRIGKLHEFLEDVSEDVRFAWKFLADVKI